MSTVNSSSPDTIGSVVGSITVDSPSRALFSFAPTAAPLGLPLLPDDEIMKLVVSRYVNAFHENFPVAVRFEVLREFSSAEMPDFLCYGIQFYTMWYAQDLPDTLGPELYVTMLRALFERIQTTLLPALNATLAGYDAAFPPGAENAPGPLAAAYRVQRDSYKRTAVAVVITMMHLLVTVNTMRTTMEARPFANYKALLKLCVRAARAAKLNREDIYGVPIEEDGRSILLLERVRRAWWVLVINDRQIAAMEHGLPEIHLSECQGVGMFLSEGQYERAASAESRETTGSLPILPAIPVNLRTSAAPNGIVDPLMAYVRLWTFFDRILHHRCAFEKPYLDTPERLAIQADLDGWYDELPELFRSMETHALASLSIGKAVGLSSKVLGFAAYAYLTYHTAQVLLSSPSEEEVWSTGISTDWMTSPAFVTCQTYAARATTLLSHTLNLPERIDLLCAPFFQYGVVRCGLIHHQFLRSALAAGTQSLGDVSLVRDAAIQLRIHRAALVAGQMGGVRSGVVGHEEGGFTHWLAVWQRMVEEPSGQIIDSLMDI